MKGQQLMIEVGRWMVHGGMDGTKAEEQEVAPTRGPERAVEAAEGVLSSCFVAPWGAVPGCVRGQRRRRVCVDVRVSALVLREGRFTSAAALRSSLRKERYVIRAHPPVIGFCAW